MKKERLESIVRKLVAGDDTGENSNPWIWNYTQRVCRNTDAICRYPSLADAQIDRDALTAAALFHAVGLAEHAAEKELSSGLVLVKPLTDVQRELSANALHQHGRAELSAAALRIAGDSIRRYHLADTDQIEARILCDAINLDEVGVLYLVRQLRLYQVEKRPVDKLVEAWQRQREYDFWGMRIEEGFRFAESREIAQTRVAAADHFITALDTSINSTDLPAAE